MLAKFSRTGRLALYFLDPAKARRGDTVRLGKAAIIENLVAWLEG